MGKREKIILLIAVLAAVLFGLYSLFPASQSKPKPVDIGEKKSELNEFIADVSGNLSKEVIDETDSYIIARAEAEWVSDPFLEIELPKKAEKEALEEQEYLKVTFTYSGYVKAGDIRLAIIDGVEYETGDELELTGYIVERIEPLKVVIRYKGKQRRIIVPMKEEEL